MHLVVNRLDDPKLCERCKLYYESHHSHICGAGCGYENESMFYVCWFYSPTSFSIPKSDPIEIHHNSDLTSYLYHPQSLKYINFNTKNCMPSLTSIASAFEFHNDTRRTKAIFSNAVGSQTAYLFSRNGETYIGKKDNDQMYAQRLTFTL